MAESTGKQFLATPPGCGIGRGEDHPHAVSLRAGQLDAQRPQLSGKELMRNMNQYARAVAGGFVGPDCPAVQQVHQYLLAVRENLMIPLA